MDLEQIGSELTVEAATRLADSFDQLLDKTTALQKDFGLPKRTRRQGNALKAARTEMNGFFADMLSEGVGFSDEFANVLGRGFDRFLTKGGDAKDLLKSMENDLLKLGSKMFTGRSTTTSGDLIGQLAGSLTSLIPGFAAGGSFTVEGQAGKDKNLVAMRLSKGEREDIKTPSQQRKSQVTQQPSFQFHYQINTPDAESFRRSQNQIQSQALQNAQRLLKRNG